MTKIGIIGTGMLGEAVGQHLLNSNYDVVVFNRTKNKTEKLVLVGATLVKSPREVAEMSLAHKVGSDVERAYARSDLLERRRVLMERWSQFVAGASGNVVRLG